MDTDQKVVYDIENRNLMIDGYSESAVPGRLEETEVHLVDGVYMVKRKGSWLMRLPSMLVYLQDLLLTVEISNDKIISSFCHDRNRFLEQKFKMHLMYAVEYEMH